MEAQSSRFSWTGNHRFLGILSGQSSPNRLLQLLLARYVTTQRLEVSSAPLKQCETVTEELSKEGFVWIREIIADRIPSDRYLCPHKASKLSKYAEKCGCPYRWRYRGTAIFCQAANPVLFILHRSGCTIYRHCTHFSDRSALTQKSGSIYPLPLHSSRAAKEVFYVFYIKHV